MTRTKNLILTFGIAAAATTACSESGSSPVEPFASDAIAAPTRGPSNLEIPLLDELLGVVEVTETFAVPAVSVPGTIVPVTVLRTSSGTHAPNDNKNGHHDDSCDGDHNEDGDNHDWGEHQPSSWTTTTQDEVDMEGNPCNDEEILFQYKTTISTREKTFHDGTVKQEEKITRKGNGTVTFAPNPLAIGTPYKGVEQEYAAEIHGPNYDNSIVAEIKFFDRQGSAMSGPDEDVTIISYSQVLHDERGRTKHFETNTFAYQCH